MRAAQAETVVHAARPLLIVAVALLASLLLCACPAQRDATEAQSQPPVPDTAASADAAAAAEGAAGDAEPGAVDEGAGEDTKEVDGGAPVDSAGHAEDGDGASAEEQLPPPEALVTQWELDGFKLGMSVRETRARMGPLLEGHLHENWVVEGETGMILAGTYAEPVKMQGSLLFLDGELVAVLASKLQEKHIFNQNFATLRAQLGQTTGQVPEFAQGRRFIDEMLAADPQPSPQYMWAQEETHSLYIIGYFEPDMLASYILLNADKYDEVAAALAGDQGS